LKETLLARYDIKFSQATTVLIEMTSELKEDNDYSITKRLFIHLITFYFHSVRSVLASFSLPCSWQGKVNVHQSAVKTK